MEENKDISNNNSHDKEIFNIFDIKKNSYFNIQVTNQTNNIKIAIKDKKNT